MNKIAIVTYESPYFRAGGIGAVMNYLPKKMREIEKDVIALTPYHISNDISNKITGLHLSAIGLFDLSYNNSKINAKLLKEDNSNWYFIKVDNNEYFAGNKHPFDLESPKLIRDSLLFGIAVIKSIKLIDSSVKWKLLLQDWEAATTAIAYKSEIENTLNLDLYLTLHNSYDAYASDDLLKEFGIDVLKCPGDTILDKSFDIVKSPLSSVSDQFANDLTDDYLQNKILIEKRQNKLKQKKIIGINNGLFSELKIPTDILLSAEKGEYVRLKNWKIENKEEALKALDEFNPSEDKPLYGNKNKFRRDIPLWFIMAGRDDPRQKGYDVASAAVDKLLNQYSNKEKAQFIFFPIPGDEGRNGLLFLNKLAETYPENVLVFPFVWKDGFDTALFGSYYGIMPSFYEPFGMANEFYLKGCVGIGRATGGLLQQIIPLRSAKCFSHSVQVRVENIHCLSAHPTGLLFRENDNIDTKENDWKGINEAKYVEGQRVEERIKYELFKEMVNELFIGINDCMNIFYDNEILYYKMLIKGINHLTNSFSWERTSYEYLRLIK